jgi:hypothetical protein
MALTPARCGACDTIAPAHAADCPWMLRQRQCAARGHLAEVVTNDGGDPLQILCTWCGAGWVVVPCPKPGQAPAHAAVVGLRMAALLAEDQAQRYVDGGQDVSYAVMSTFAERLAALAAAGAEDESTNRRSRS